VQYSLEQLFNQAAIDPSSSSLHGSGYEAYILYGIKINKDLATGCVQFLDTSKAGSFYKPIPDEDMEVFREHGWRYGIYVLSLSNYRLKLDKVERQIKKYVNSKPSRPSKLLNNYHTSRTNIMKLYSEITNKLNQLKLNQHGKIEKTNDI
jgi:hypothetical protein